MALILIEHLHPKDRRLIETSSKQKLREDDIVYIFWKDWKVHPEFGSIGYVTKTKETGCDVQCETGIYSFRNKHLFKCGEMIKEEK